MKLKGPNLAQREGGVLAFAAPYKKKTREQREAELDEAVIETYLRLQLRGHNAYCKKMITDEQGWPDRICVWPEGVHDWVELKRPKGRALPAAATALPRAAAAHGPQGVCITHEGAG
jgi:hypothetical protein